jgi:hypothetical protein
MIKIDKTFHNVKGVFIAQAIISTLTQRVFVVFGKPQHFVAGRHAPAFEP